MSTATISVVPSSIPPFESALFAPIAQVEEIRFERVHKTQNMGQLKREQKDEDLRARKMRVFDWVTATYADASIKQPAVAQRYSEIYRNTKRTAHFIHYMLDCERLTKKALGGSSVLWNAWCEI